VAACPWCFPGSDRRPAILGLPEHGFARTTEWSVESVARADDGSVAAVLALEATDATRTLWPHEFRAQHRVVVGPRLEMSLEIENRSRVPLTFEAALHTYLLVGDVREATLSGLEGTTYIDKTDGMKRKTQGSEPLRLREETDRVFVGTRTTCVVDDPVLSRRIVVEKGGSDTTVVWNPWSEKARTIADLEPDGWRSLLCVETANAGDAAVRLAPGERHQMTAALRAAPI